MRSATAERRPDRTQGLEFIQPHTQPTTVPETPAIAETPTETQTPPNGGITQTEKLMLFITEGDVPDTVISDVTDRVLVELEIRGRSDFTDR